MFAVSKLGFEARFLERGEDFLALGVRALVSRLQWVTIVQAVEFDTRLSAAVTSFDEPVVLGGFLNLRLLVAPAMMLTSWVELEHMAASGTLDTQLLRFVVVVILGLVILPTTLGAW